MKSAVQILTESLEDIRQNGWCQTRLALYGTAGEDTIDEVSIDLDDLKNVRLRKRPQNCALGLVSVHGGITHDVVFKGRTYHVPDWASSTKVSRSVLKALRCLYEALPAGSVVFKTVPDKDVEKVAFYERHIYTYNDSHDCTRKKAIAWFERAITLAEKK